MERILEIEEIENYRDDCHTDILYDGYLIKTDKQEIYILISNGQCCCEDWGYFSSEDNFDDFIGAELFGIYKVDSEYKTKHFDGGNFDEGGAVFVNLETLVGTLQFSVYNAHKGYYGHEIIIKSNQLNYSTVL